MIEYKTIENERREEGGENIEGIIEKREYRMEEKRGGRTRKGNYKWNDDEGYE